MGTNQMSNPTTMASKSEVFSVPFLEVGTDDNSALTQHRQTLFAISDNPAPWLVDALVELKQLRSLESNWDSYDATPISDDSICHAESVLQKLAHITNVPIPTVSATPDGYVGFCWDTGAWSLDAWIEDDGRISYTYLDETNSANDQEAWTLAWQDLVPLLTQW